MSDRDDDDANRLDPVHVELWCPRGPELPWQVLSLRGREQLSAPYSFEIEVQCDDASVEVEAALGADAELLLERNGLTRAVYGVITAVEVQSSPLGTPDHEGLIARLRLEPALSLLRQELDTRFHTGQSAVEILAERLGDSLGRYGRKLDSESGLAGTYNRRDYCVQFRETTFEFCSRLMEEEGITYMFVPDPDSETERMVLVDNNEAYAATELLASEPLALVSHAPEELGHESLQRFDWRSRRVPNRVLTRAHNYKQPKRVDEGEAEVYDAHNHDVRELAIAEGPRQIIDDPVDDPDATSFTGAELDQRGRAAKLLLERLAVGASHGRGRSNAHSFGPGGTFELAELPRGLSEPELLITEVDHEARREDGGLTGAHAYANHFECVARAQPFRPPARTAKPRVFGVLTGVVVGRGGDEVLTDALGRVRVRLHVDRHGGDDDQQTCWIRVAQMWAGPGYGAMVLPRVGMQVVVAFVDGDPDCPLITGCVYDGDNTPPRPLPAELSRSTFKSSSTPGGEGFNELMIEDAKGREQVFVHAQRRMDLRVRGSLFETVVGNREEVVGVEDPASGDHNTLVYHNANVIVRKQRFTHAIGEDCTVTSRRVLSCDELLVAATDWRISSENCSLAAKARCDVAADTLALAGHDTVSIKGGTAVLIESNNDLHLKSGASFITLGREGVRISGPKIWLNSGGQAQSAEEAQPKTEGFKVYYPMEAYSADDGRPGGGGGGGGGGGQGRRRTNEFVIQGTFKPPPMRPRSKVKNLIATEQEMLDDVLHQGIKKLWWSPIVAWCSDPLRLMGQYEDGGGVEGPGTIMVVDSDGNQLAAWGRMIPGGHDFELPVTVSGILPEEVGGQRQSSRSLIGAVRGEQTLAPLQLLYLSDLEPLHHHGGRSRFSVWMTKGTVHFGGTINYTPGWMYYTIDLSDYVPEDTGGRIDDNRPEWYCRKIVASVAATAANLEYWNGSEWTPVPSEWKSHFGTRLSGIAVWREGDKIKTQFGKRPWPAKLPEWSADKRAELATKIQETKANIETEWSNQFDVRRTACASENPRCCRHPLVAQVQFREVSTKTKKSIIWAGNNSRDNASCWSWSINKQTAAHEFGHHLGNPDEYFGATSVDPSVNGDGARMGIDKAGLMGAGSTPRARYYDRILMVLTLCITREHAGDFEFRLERSLHSLK